MSRYKARQQALQILFSREFHEENDIQYTESEILETNTADEQDAFEENDDLTMQDENVYCTYLVETTRQHMAEFDKIIGHYSKKWDLSQMDRTDKFIMRMSLCELLYPKENIEESIVLNEAVRLAKRYGGPASSRFVNGILGAYVKDKR